MKDVDIYEFFTFLPEQLLQEIEDLHTTFQTSDPTFTTIFTINYQIFTQYVLKHCFSLPTYFHINRKLHYKQKNVSNLKNIINDISNIQDEIDYLENEKITITNNKILYNHKINKYTQFIDQLNILDNYDNKIVKINEKIEDLDNVYNKMCIMGCEQNGSGIAVLTDNVMYKREMEVKDRNEMVERYDVNEVDEVIEMHGKCVDNKS